MIVIGANSRAVDQHGAAGEFVDADHGGHRGKLEQPDILVEQRRDHVAQRNGHDHQAQRLRPREAGGERGLHQSGPYRAQAGADVFCQIGGDEQDKAQHRGAVGAGLVGEQRRQAEIADEQHHQQRRAAHEADVKREQLRQHRHAQVAHHPDDETEGGAAQDRPQRDLGGETKPAQQEREVLEDDLRHRSPSARRRRARPERAATHRSRPRPAAGRGARS